MKQTLVIWTDNQPMSEPVSRSFEVPRETATFIMPNRAEEIFAEKADATIDDILQ